MLLKLYSLAFCPLLVILLAPTAIHAAPTLEYGTFDIAVTDSPHEPHSDVYNFKRGTMWAICKQGTKPQVALADADESVMYCCPLGYTVAGQRYKEGWVCCHDSLSKGECAIGKHEDFRGGSTPEKCYVDGQLTDTVERDRAFRFSVCQSLALAPAPPPALRRDDTFDNTGHNQPNNMNIAKRHLNNKRFEDVPMSLEWWCSVRQDPRYCPAQIADASNMATDSSSDKRAEHNIDNDSFCINYPYHKDCQVSSESNPPAESSPPHALLSRGEDGVECPHGTTSQIVENSPGLKAYVCCPTDFPKAGWTTKSEIIPTCCKGNPDQPKLKGCPLASGGDRADSIKPVRCPGKFSLENRCGTDLCLWRSDWIGEEFVKCPKL